MNTAAKRAGDELTSETSPGSTSGPKTKVTRVDRGPVEYSSHIRTKISNQTRTGQACDRCKYRKIKCDTATGPCAHCREVKTECLVTDRVSGITARRGYYQELERTKEKLEAHTKQLEAILRANGIDVHPWQVDEAGDPIPPVSLDAEGNPNDASFDQDHWARFNDTVWVKNYQERPTAEPAGTVASLSQTKVSDFYTMPGNGLFGPADASNLHSRPTNDNPVMLGLAIPDNEPLSTITGTTLSIMGTKIDICSLDTVDIENHKSNEDRELPNVSIKAFMLSLTNSIPQPEIHLPSRAEGMGYAEWYFLIVNPYAPALHKPTFMAMLTRMYDEPNYQPTRTEKSLAHLVFSLIFYHYGLRGDDDPANQRRLRELSHQHYHWTLHNFVMPSLDISLQGLQVFYLQALHARNFPKPGCSHILATFAFNRAIEMNLHKNPPMVDGKHTLQTEMHKRLWWSIVGLLVTLDGRLGNPMPIGLQDINCEFPLLIPDEELTAEGIKDESRIGQSPYSVGLTGLRLVPLYMELYSNLYSIHRDPTKYIPLVKRLEQGIERWQKSLPPELQAPALAVALAESANNPFAVTVNRCYPVYSQVFASEFRLSLRHPSVAMTNAPEILAENTRICEEEADQLLRCAHFLKKCRALDTTWYQLAVWCCAMFTKLSCSWQRRINTTPEAVKKLRTDMDMWMETVTEIARLVGAKPEDNFILRLRRIISDTMASIEDQARPNPAPISHPPPAQHHGSAQERNEFVQPPASDAPIRRSDGVDNAYYAGTPGANALASTPAQTIPYGQIAYQDPAHAVPYLSVSNSPYIFNGAGAPSDHAPPSNPLIAFASQAAQHVASYHATPAPPPLPDGAYLTPGAWQEWQSTFADGQAQDRFSATVLMDLQAQQQHQVPQHPHPQGHLVQRHAELPDGGGAEVSNSGAQWPLNLFNIGSQMPEEQGGGH